MGAENYTLGKGILYFNRKDMNTGEFMGERDLGNAPAFSFNIAIERLEHFSSRGGLRVKDKSIISQVTPSCSFTLDEITAENFEILALATVSEVKQVSGNETDEEHIAHLGKYISLSKREVSNVVVKDNTAATTYVAGVDYLVEKSKKDDQLGRVFILATGNIGEGDNLKISFDYAQSSYKEVKLFTETQVEGELRFVSDNPAGTQTELRAWKVSLTPSSDTAFIGDDWSTMSFSAEVLRDSENHPDSPYMSIIMK